MASAEELYREAYALACQGRQAEADARLRKAAEQGFAPARYTLALNLLQRDGRKAAGAARALLEQGGPTPLIPAAQLLAMIALLGLDGPPDVGQALAIIEAGAGRGAPSFLRQIGVAMLLADDAAGAAAEGEALLFEAARRGDILASLALTRLRVEGGRDLGGIPPIPAATRARLAEAGHPAAELPVPTVPASPAAPPPVPLAAGTAANLEAACRRLRGLLDAVPATPLGEERRGADGYAVRVHRRVWPALACDYVATLALPHLQPSTVLDPRSGRMRMHPVRRSHHATLYPWDQDLVTWLLERRLAALVGAPADHGEMLCILHYPPGGEYRPHLDALTAEGGTSGAEIARSGQRTHTVLVRLSGAFAGGETHFPKAGLTFSLEPGDALVFPNVDEKGEPDPRSLHAGLPVRNGVKWMATKWIRARPYVW
ncbi:MAG: hypothetical protein KatS3mg119_0547 [Rhodothalassiaceae bacterium]|nr:MAG: hypothetical protein KatS3mg119_0547 [Rhodothalassiaceae bacterium]